MIEEAESETYYYHGACPERSRGDALGSVVALSDSSGDTVQTYEYSVYGQVAVEDADHPNPYMFAGRRFDIEIGLYYNRNRYYNPFMGRFLQTDPIGYGDGMNMYRYCKNNSLNFVDPSGLAYFFYDGRTGECSQLDGEWNSEGIGVFFNLDPCDLETYVCGEDTIYAYNGTRNFRYWGEGEVQMGDEIPFIAGGARFNVDGEGNATYNPDESVSWVTLQVSGAFGVSGLQAHGLVWDSDGNLGWIYIYGAGGGTPSAGLALQAGEAVGTGVPNLEGPGIQAGASGGPVLGIAVDFVSGENYTGGEVGLSLGALPFEEHGVMTYTEVVGFFNSDELIINFLSVFINNPWE